MSDTETLRQPAETHYAEELAALAAVDDDSRPRAWKLSPRMVLRYVVGTDKPLVVGSGKQKRTIEISRKFFGDDGLVERAIVTLASERALLLVGEPGTGKSWLSEHLAAAISGCSTLTLQGTAGTTEEHLKYSWNVARVIAEGPTANNLIPSPTMIAMRAGSLLRFEEITRCVPDVQDALVSVLSDKAIAVPELPGDNLVWAKPGFNVIATANTRDQGVNELSAALKRRFNYVYLPVVGDRRTEVEIVKSRSADLLQRYAIDAKLDETVITLLATVFREIRDGKTAEGVQVKQPSTTLSTAEAIGVALDAAISARFFGDGTVGPEHVARNIVGSIVKEDRKDLKILEEYLGLVAKKRATADPVWKRFHDAAVRAVREG
ncbi:MAG: AAA family ATPase [Alphaproteobacteria bacterium]|nr:AAA family ATPase [Alphaproteobacteria bacterium]